MGDWFRIVGPDGELEIAGVRLVGVTAATGKKLLLTALLVVVVVLLAQLARRLTRAALGGEKRERISFWVHQTISLFATMILIIGVLSIWFGESSRLATFMGLVSAGVAFALQKVITAIAGYFIILRGKTFRVGDRITMGGVRGDVIEIGYFQTRIMEMGQPNDIQDANAPTWVYARQYTGRIVTVTNDKIFDQPVYNYTRDFPYLWDEMHLPIPYKCDRARAEQILLKAADRHTVQIRNLGEAALNELQRRYVMKREDLGPRVYYRLTDNWVEMTLRFLTLDHRIRELKDAVSREIIDELDAAGIGIASSTYDVVGMPALRVMQGAPIGLAEGTRAPTGQHAAEPSARQDTVR